MNLLKKIGAGIFITFGLMILVLAVGDLTDAEKSKEDKDGAFAALIVFGIPSGMIGGSLAWNVVQGGRKQKEKLAAQESDRLQSIFYLLLKNNHGSITPLLFAMEAQLSPTDAKVYLDQKAKEFDANFDADDQGGIIYQFNLGNLGRSLPEE
jgi:hypothetical protein